jgi:EAL domain-containing protein (putative c-di-GMP-specific phosphodiesterase class I)
MNLHAPTRSPDDGDAHAEQCARIREGIRNGEFRLVWQPIVDVREGTAVGAEALLRWQHPERGLLNPGAFEPFLHDPDVAGDITAFAIDQIAANLASLPASERRGFVSFNVYPSQLRDGRLKQLVETRYLARGGAPEALMIEFVANVKALRATGVTVAIDDLGSGAWTLTDLQRLEVDVVKLAGELLREIPSSDVAMKVLTGTLRILDALGVQVVVEGVETDGQAAWAETVPRLWAQGYAFSRPRADLADAIGWARSPDYACA